MCQTALGGPDDPLAKAMNVSILFLMAMPFALAGAVGGWFLYMHWRPRAGRRALRVVPATKEGRL
jgi:hypothetical protein